MKVYCELNVFFNHQAQLFAKREHEGVVQMLEVSVYVTLLCLHGEAQKQVKQLCARPRFCTARLHSPEVLSSI